MGESLPKWRCHKEVWADKVVEERTDSISGLREWILRTGTKILVDENLLFRGGTNPVGGYFVRYEDGFESWSPAKVFEAGYKIALKEKTMKFVDEVKVLINKCSKENGSDTPDFILAQYLNACLDAFDIATKQRDTWYSFVPWPEEEIKRILGE